MKKTLVLLSLLIMTTTLDAHAIKSTQIQNNDKVMVNSPVIKKKGIAAPSKVPAFKPRKFKGRVMDENVLVVLMDFSDRPNSTLSKSETDNYFPKYTKSYYQNLFFGTKFKAPDNRYYNTLKSYYKQTSGDSLNLKGQVTGWHRAKHPLTYYGANNDDKVYELIMEAARAAQKDKSINLNNYDKYDYYDQDMDGNVHEPDGMIDKLVVVFSGVGESKGGGKYGEQSIWEHVGAVPFASNGQPPTLSGTKSKYSKFYKQRLAVGEYGVLAEDSTVGTFAHEFGHMLGLIDEYDTAPTNYEHAGEPIRFWSLMSYGADAGKINGTLPVSMSPLARMDLQRLYGGNWVLGSEINFKDITKTGKTYLIDQASIKGVNNDVIKINLPDIVKKNKNGKYVRYQNYYLVEWRSHNGIDKGLGEIYDPLGKNAYGKGMLVWYVNESYVDNSDLVKHLGKGLVGVVDANPKTIMTRDGFSPMTDTQVYDATFNTKDYGNYNKSKSYYFKKTTKAQPLFYDKNYSSTAFKSLKLPEAGRILPQLGLKIRVMDQNVDGTVAKIKIYK